MKTQKAVIASQCQRVTRRTGVSLTQGATTAVPASVRLAAFQKRPAAIRLRRSAQACRIVDPRSVVDQFYNAYRTRDVDRLVNLLADKVVFDDPTFRLHQEGRDAIRKMATDTFAAFNDITIDVHSVVTMGDTVATEQTVAGVVTHPDRAKRNIKVRGASFFRVRDGQIYRWTDYFDFQTFSEQTRQ